MICTMYIHRALTFSQINIQIQKYVLYSCTAEAILCKCLDYAPKGPALFDEFTTDIDYQSISIS